MTKPTSPRTPASRRSTSSFPPFRTAEGVFVVDDSQRIVGWSEAATQLFGRDEAEVMGRPCFEVLGTPADHYDCRPGCRMILESRRGRVLAHPDIHARHADGHALTVRATALQLPEAAMSGGSNGRREPAAKPRGTAAGDAPADGPGNGAPGNDAPVASEEADRPERHLLVHLVRPRSGSTRRSRHHALPPREAAGHEDVPPLVSPLSRRELEVLHLLAAGRSTRQIAETLTLSPYTARNHILSIEQKLGAHSRVEALYLARRHGLI